MGWDMHNKDQDRSTRCEEQYNTDPSATANGDDGFTRAIRLDGIDDCGHSRLATTKMISKAHNNSDRLSRSYII